MDVTTIAPIAVLVQRVQLSFILKYLRAAFLELREKTEVCGVRNEHMLRVKNQLRKPHAHRLFSVGGCVVCQVNQSIDADVYWEMQRKLEELEFDVGGTAGLIGHKTLRS